MTCAVNMLSRFQSRASHALFSAAMRVLQYLYTTRHKLLTYTAYPSRTPKLTIDIWCDASNNPCCAPGKKHGMSTTGIAVFITGIGGAVDWICTRQTIVGRNSTEAEIIASTDATPKAVRWRNFMEAASHEQQGSTGIYLDNESNVCNMFNLSGANTQHLNKRLAYSRDVVQRKLVRPRSVSGKDNCSDLLTKSLPTPDHVRHADKLLGITHARSFL